jgi:hypothetical protein
MGLSYAHQRGLNQLLLEVAPTDPQERIGSRPPKKFYARQLDNYFNPSEIVAVGLEKATVTANNPGPETQLSCDRWWYDLHYHGDGTTSRGYIDCSMTEPASEANDVAVEQQNTGAE